MSLPTRPAPRRKPSPTSGSASQRSSGRKKLAATAFSLHWAWLFGQRGLYGSWQLGHRSGLVNAAILVVSAAVFHARGHHDVAELQEAHKLLAPMLGAPIAATAFAVVLLASGQSSTITGTLAGQIVMEGFLNIRITPWLRRLITRCLAMVPALVLISLSGGKNTVGLLVMSQVVLSMQLPFAIFPLMMFTSDPRRMGQFVNSLATKIVGYAVCIVIAALNVYLLFQTIGALWLSLLATVMIGFTIWVSFFYREKPKSA